MGYRNKSFLGFTIVELLVVIVVIGVLAAITIVSYTGISQKAIASSLQSDLATASTQLKMFQVENSAYPNSITDCPTPSAGNLCLKATPGNNYSSYSANNTTSPQTFILLASNGGQIYKINNSSTPIALEPAPLSPVADWLATTQGDHYGNFYDLVTKQYATVTRNTPKTIYDPTTQHIYDIPVNKLAVNPRSDGKNGVEAVIEGQRTNYMLNSNGAANNGARWNSINTYDPVNCSYSIVQGIYSNTAQHIVATGATNVAFMERGSVGTTAAGSSAILSFYYRGTTTSGMTSKMASSPYNAAGWVMGIYSPELILDGMWHRGIVSHTNLSADIISIEMQLFFYGTGTAEITLDAVQIEKTDYAGSYIPTTTTTATRNADVVTVPTTSWSAGTGTFVGVSGPTSVIKSGDPDWPYAWMFAWGSSPSSFIGFNLRGTPIMYLADSSNGTERASAINGTNGRHVLGMTYQNAGLIYSYLDGVTAGGQSYISPSGLPTTANIGGWTVNNGHEYNGSIQRLIVYSSALSSSDVSTVTNAINDGP